MRFRSAASSQQTPSKPFHDMSAMIDIVFLLLVFFMLTLQIADPEGSHELTAQAKGPGPGAVIPAMQFAAEFGRAADSTWNEGESHFGKRDRD